MGGLEKAATVAQVGQFYFAGVGQFYIGANTLLKEAEEREIEKGIEQGIEKGVEIGVEKGAQEKSRNTLTKLLTLRFGPLSEAVAQRLGEARVEQLDAWIEKVLFACTLEDVFRD